MISCSYNNKGVEVFDIILENEQAVYHEGDRISGTVVLETKEDIKMRGVFMELCGVALVQWDGDGTAIGDADDKPRGDCNKEEYFKEKIPLMEKEGGFLDKDPILSAGSYTFPFEAKLPPELPSTFEGQYGQVRYLAKAYIERPWKSNITVKRAFSVVSGLDLNFIPEAAVKIELCKYREVGNLCCISGPVTIDWMVRQSGFVPGEDIHITGSVQNDSNEPLTISKAVLYMVVDYKAKKRRRKERHQVAAVDKGQTLPGEVTVWNEHLHIPPVPPTGYARCKLIDVNYELQFTASFEGKYAPITFSKDIYIGTVPINRKEMRSCIAGMFNQPYKESMDNLSEQTRGSMVSLTKIIAAASASESTVNPSAPTLATLGRQVESHQGTAVAPSSEEQGQVAPPTPPEVLLERPPPFAPGHDPEGLMTSPLLPAEMAVSTQPQPEARQNKDNLYPTLAASWFGKVSIREPGDSESVQGELSYAPVYTYYSQD